MRGSGSNPGALLVRAAVAAVPLLSAAWLAGAVDSARGAERSTVSEAASVRKDTFRDIKLATKARAALSEDKQLSLLRLFIMVKDRVAILEGEVTSEEQLRAAAKRVEKVTGIAEVRTGLVRVVAPKSDDVLTIPLTVDPPVRTEVRSQNHATSTVARPTALPHVPQPSPEVVTVRLEAPIPLPPPGVEPVTSLRTTTPRGDDALAAAVEQARLANARFRSLEVEVRGDLVWLRGSAEQLDTGMEFARALTDLGVRHVVIQCTLPVGP
jgi:osmotically-inducible protein OsmY